MPERSIRAAQAPVAFGFLCVCGYYWLLAFFLSEFCLFLVVVMCNREQ